MGIDKADEVCQICGTKEQVEEHHTDYEKNKKVYLCKCHHEEVHHTDKWIELKPNGKSEYKQLKELCDKGLIDKSKKISVSITLDKENIDYCNEHKINMSRWVNKELIEEFSGKILAEMDTTTIRIKNTTKKKFDALKGISTYDNFYASLVL